MELIKRLDKIGIESISNVSTGMKKWVWYSAEGKKYVLVTFGMKKDILVEGVDENWNDIRNVYLEKKRKVKVQKDVVITPGDLLVWLKNSYLENASLLHLGLLCQYTPLNKPKIYWEYANERDGREAFLDVTTKMLFNMRGDIKYKKRRGGYVIALLGNWYFLPKGESLRYYKPGIWKSHYVDVMKNLGIYADGATSLCYSNFYSTLPLDEGYRKGGMIMAAVKYLLLQEMSYIFGRKRSRRRIKRYKDIRTRALFLYGYYLYMLLPVWKNFLRIRRVALKAGLTENELQKLLMKGDDLVKRKEEKKYEVVAIMYDKCVKEVYDSKDTLDLCYYLVLSNLLYVIYKYEQEATLSELMRIERFAGLKVSLSREAKKTKQSRILTPVSRRNLI